MRHVRIFLTAATLLVTALSLPGCAASRAAKAGPGPGPEPGQASLGRLDDPSFLFDNRPLGQAKTLQVKALAYTGGCSPRNSRQVPRGAWGDRLTPDVKAVAVSPDLLEMGLDRGDVITIEGLPGQYKVLDVMHDRHGRTIDIFYGNDACGARQWGKRELTITWQ